MTWNPPTDAELTSGKPILATVMRRLRDLTASAFAGDSGAPNLNRKAISAGGTGVDGPFTNPGGVSGLGYFEPSSIAFTAAGALPAVSIIRCSGNVRISDVITLDRVNAANALRVQQHLRGRVGVAGADLDGHVAGANASGGANIGSNGAGTAGGIDVTGLNRSWYSLRPLVGGKGGDITDGSGNILSLGGSAGGCLIMLVEGDVDMTSGTIRCNGDDGLLTSGAFFYRSGPGAGGSIIIVCTGTLTGGTYEAKGGSRCSGGTDGAGGGYIGLVAPTFAGSRTKTVTGGTGSVNGAAGYAEEVVLTAEVIRGLLMRSF